MTPEEKIELALYRTLTRVRADSAKAGIINNDIMNLLQTLIEEIQLVSAREAVTHR